MKEDARDPPSQPTPDNPEGLDREPGQETLH